MIRVRIVAEVLIQDFLKHLFICVVLRFYFISYLFALLALKSLLYPCFIYYLSFTMVYNQHLALIIIKLSFIQ